MVRDVSRCSLVVRRGLWYETSTLSPARSCLTLCLPRSSWMGGCAYSRWRRPTSSSTSTDTSGSCTHEKLIKLNDHSTSPKGFERRPYGQFQTVDILTLWCRTESRQWGRPELDCSLPRVCAGTPALSSVLSKWGVRLSTRANWSKIGAIAGVVAVVVAIVALRLTRGDSGDVSSSVNSGNTGISCSAAGGASCVLTGKSFEQESENEILARSEDVQGATPTGNGPWPFVVAQDGGIGLKVRTNGLKDGHAVGGLATHHVAWVVCQEDTGFDPDGNGSSIWYQITWPGDAVAGGAFFESEVSSEGRGWAYATYLYPVATSRDVPLC